MTAKAMRETDLRQTMQINKYYLDRFLTEEEMQKYAKNENDSKNFLHQLIEIILNDYKLMMERYRYPDDQSLGHPVLFQDFKFSDYWSHGREDLFCVNGKLVSMSFHPIYTKPDGYPTDQWGCWEALGPPSVMDSFTEIALKVKSQIITV